MFCSQQASSCSADSALLTPLQLLVSVIGSLAICVFAALVVWPEPGHLMHSSHKGVVLQDFSYHYLVFRDYWTGYISSVYSIGGQVSAIERFFGLRLGMAMPIGISPLFVVLSGPLVYSLGDCARSLYLGWITASFFVFLSGVLPFCGSLGRRKTVLLLLLVVCSDAFGRWLYVGQTSLMATGCTLWFVRLFRDDQSRGSWGRLAAQVLVAVLLSTKPTYLIMPTLYLLQQRRLRELIIVFALVGGLQLGSLCFLPATTLVDYAHQLSIYSGDMIPDYYADSLNTGTQNEFRSFCESFGMRSIGIVASQFILGFVALWMLAACLSDRVRQGYAALVFTIPMIFVPYQGTYEELLLVVPLLVCQPVISLGQRGRNDRYAYLLVGALLWIHLMITGLSEIPILVRFAVKLSLLLSVVIYRSPFCSSAPNSFGK